MVQKRGNVYSLPLNKSKIYYWFAQYRNLQKTDGDYLANTWLTRNVPEQLHKQIYQLYHAYRLKTKRKKK